MLIADNLLERGDGDGRLHDWFTVRREVRLAPRDFSRADHRLSVHRLWLDCRDRCARRWRRQRRARRRCRHFSGTHFYRRLFYFSSFFLSFFFFFFFFFLLVAGGGARPPVPPRFFFLFLPPLFFFLMDWPY